MRREAPAKEPQNTENLRLEVLAGDVCARQAGLEPATFASAGRRSNPLSYWRLWRGGRDLNPRGTLLPLPT